MIIYKITNKLNNKSYIGQTHKTLKERWRRHCWTSEYKKNMPISKSFLIMTEYLENKNDPEIIKLDNTLPKKPKSIWCDFIDWIKNE